MNYVKKKISTKIKLVQLKKILVQIKNNYCTNKNGSLVNMKIIIGTKIRIKLQKWSGKIFVIKTSILYTQQKMYLHQKI